MTTSIISTNTIGAGPQFTYAVSGDHLIILDGVTLGATSGDALAGTGFNDIALTILGSLAGSSQLIFGGTDAVITIAAGGSFVSSETLSANGAVYLSGNLATFTNAGTFVAPTSIGLISNGGNEIANTGSILGASPVFLGLFGGGPDTFVNSGSVVANSYDDAARTERFNNGVFTEGGNTLISNLAGGIITAVSSEGAGVRLGEDAGGSVVSNYGTIESLQDFGVNLGTVSSGQSLISVLNWGTIRGLDGSYNGSVNADSLVNHGLLIGNVNMGDGADRFVNSGTVEGDVNLGSGVDVYDGSLGTASGTVYGDGDNDTFFVGTGVDSYDGGLGADYLDFGKTGATQMALDDSIDFSGSSAGDTYTGFEHVYGSAFDDVIYGSAGANLLVGRAGNDTINGGAGGDTLRGGTGIDALTGGLGNDRFQYLALADCGDTITDFHNVAGDDDAFYISATKFGGGLVAGTLAASQFRSRADNLAQDADDRFIFRTTDQTLWYDADGNGAGAAIMVADLNADASLSNLDIVII